MCKVNVITGPLSYTGRYISEILLQKGQIIRGLTNHPNRFSQDPFVQKQQKLIKESIQLYEMDLDNIQVLQRALKGADNLFFTYWVRFNNYENLDRKKVIQRAKNLIEAVIFLKKAKAENIKKIIFTSHTNSSIDSPFEYIQGKAQVEKMIKESGISYGFAKPCVIYGSTPSESILINNMAYLIRTFPIILIPGSGQQLVQPVHVKSLAQLCVEMSITPGNQEIDAIGQKMTYYELLNSVKKSVASRSLLIKNVPTNICYYATKPIDYWFQDKLLEKDDLSFLNEGLLTTNQDPICNVDIKQWIQENQEKLGIHYLNSTQIYYKK